MSYKLLKPFSDTDRINFIVEYNHKRGLIIKETDKGFYALEENEIMQDNEPVIDPDFETKQLQTEKENKLKDCLNKAYEAEEKSTILYKNNVFETNAATLAKLTTYYSMMKLGIISSVQWLSKDDTQINLTEEDIMKICQLITEFSSALWNVQYLSFKEQINNAKTINELKEITIEY